MLLSGAVMLTKNRCVPVFACPRVSSLTLVFEIRYLAWVALLFAISGYMNTRPLRTKDGGQGLSGIA